MRQIVVSRGSSYEESIVGATEGRELEGSRRE
jgi:hypothetical protein